MCLQDEIIETLVEETECLMIADGARRYAHDRLDEGDDDYQFIEDALDRWGDRNVNDPTWNALKR